MEWMLMPFRRYAEFSGRSRRKEFWMFQLLNVIVVAVLYSLLFAGGAGSLLGLGATPGAPVNAENLQQVSLGPVFWIAVVLLAIWGLGTIIPSIALAVRRLHDRNVSGWYLLGFIVAVIVLSMIPVLGTILVFAAEIGYIVFMALPGTAGPNKYGPDPLDPNQVEVFS
jgi:uncharacterized membrane protein YhaH (DUF805 family)